MVSQNNSQKIIGTLVPLSALFSSTYPKEDKGTFSAGFAFLNWLKKTNQDAWQLLPLHETQLEPTGNNHVPSPYKSYGIGLSPKYLPEEYKKLIPAQKELDDFTTIHKNWLPDYALFCSLRDEFLTDDWREWEFPLRSHDPGAILLWREKLKDSIDKYIRIQFLLHQAYDKLHTYAKQLGIVLIGDLSFYLSVKSPLVWANQQIFQIKKDGSMPYVSGIPDTNKTHFGRQVWGHPLYNWEAKDVRAESISFWKTRMSYQASLFDVIRFDHANAFFEYGEIDPENKENDKYKKGPGIKIFEELVGFANSLGLRLFVEDSGEDLRNLRKSMLRKNIPGIKILRFALDERKNRLNSKYADFEHYPHETVLYTTTHDTESLLGFLNNLTPLQKQKLANAAHIAYDSDNKIFAKIIRDGVLSSHNQMVIIPIQDWLLTTDRINIPGTELPINDPNWHYSLNIPVEELPTHF